MARSRGRGRRELKSEINIVPLLDVLLVLLLIFMATAPIITQSVEVDLPDATESQAVSTNDDPPVIIEVSGVGQYSVVVEKIVWISYRQSRLLLKRSVAWSQIRKRSS
jgi:biopolymer transport protein TolR